MTVSVLGWVATAVFASSYFYSEPATLKKIQAAAACLWIVYGIAIGAVPVVVANLIVAGAALYSSLRPLSSKAGEPPAQSPNPAVPLMAVSIAEDIKPDNA
jgi:hypothetical protein